MYSDFRMNEELHNPVRILCNLCNFELSLEIKNDLITQMRTLWSPKTSTWREIYVFKLKKNNRTIQNGDVNGF